jgi:hypothetical protein
LGEEITCTKETKLQQQKRDFELEKKLVGEPSINLRPREQAYKGRERRKKESSIVALG